MKTRPIALFVAMTLCGFWTVTSLQADVSLPSVFGTGMVLQQGRPVPVWGWADAGEKVTVSFRDQSVSATASDEGEWKVQLEPVGLGEPGTLTVAGNNTVTFDDVLVGEVWVCSGQSNMQWSVRASLDPDLEAASANFPKIRLFKVPMVTAKEPQTNVPAEWQVCSPETVPDFSAVAYYHGRQLHQVLGVPVGLIQTAWGGTRAEAWTSPSAMASTEELQPILDAWAEQVAHYDPEQARQRYEVQLKRWEEQAEQAKQQGRSVPRRPQAPTDPRLDRHHPSNLYNAMVAPLVPYAIRGAIWYQGESNASRADQYRTLMPVMIQSWRDAWNQGDFPFYQVQLANFREIQEEPGDSDWAELREAQYLTTQALPHVGAVCITDLGAARDIHPRDKQNVGKRLARLALHHDYDNKGIVPQGPTYKSMEVVEGKCLIRFETHGSPLTSWYREPLTGFALAGKNQQWAWGNAKIIDSETIEISHPDISDPVAVRYNWADNPQGNLYNELYLPAYPFRTDDWPGITIDNVRP